MSYPDELCRLVIGHMEIIEEAPAVVEEAQNKLFVAINERIKRRVAARAGWKGCYELGITSGEQGTRFAPSAWPEDDAGAYLAYYYLDQAADICDHWLSVALGLRGDALCLHFHVERALSNLVAKEHKKLFLDFYSATPSLAESGFQIDKNGEIFLPFILNASKVAEEYPDFDEALEPLDAALETLFKAHGAFAGFMNAFLKHKGTS